MAVMLAILWNTLSTHDERVVSEHKGLVDRGEEFDFLTNESEVGHLESDDRTEAIADEGVWSIGLNLSDGGM